MKKDRPKDSNNKVRINNVGTSELIKQVQILKIRKGSSDIMKNRNVILIGILSPILYFVASIIGGTFNEGYNHIKHSVSELLIDGTEGLAVVNTFMLFSNLVLIAIGILVIVRLKNVKNTVLKIGIILVHIPGITNILSSFVFKLSEGNSLTFSTVMHIAFVAISALVSVIGIVMIVVSYNKTYEWKRIKLFSAITMAILVIGGLITPWVVSSGYEITGLVERVSVLSLNVWYVVLLIKLRKELNT